MTKTTCDVCGEEIKDFRERWQLSLCSQAGIKQLKYGQHDWTMEIGDVCQECAAKIHHSITAIKTP